METEIHPTPLFKNLYFNFYELLIELILSEWSLKIPWKIPIDFSTKFIHQRLDIARTKVKTYV